MSQRSNYLFTGAQLGSLFIFMLPFVLYIRTKAETIVQKDVFIMALIAASSVLLIALIISATTLIKDKEISFYWFLSLSLSFMGAEISFTFLMITGSLAGTQILNNSLAIGIFFLSILILGFLVIVTSQITTAIEEYYTIPKKNVEYRSIAQLFGTTIIILLSFFALT